MDMAHYDTYSVTDCRPWQHVHWDEVRWISGAEDRKRKRKDELEERQAWLRRRKERIARSKAAQAEGRTGRPAGGDPVELVNRDSEHEFDRVGLVDRSSSQSAGGDPGEFVHSPP